ncbi:hypothetical protein [Saccharothrix australiensis]|uniref:Uncharacterized protein n=1 Tax=Saccharothrix australiensis TaxID=2072 RepID=A0A495VT13_9PSEU|nr:hypothetical protein [Saccharothrix australiensis]RKT51555.1 hypothetical protein C8E97_0034 [Saccharothrix australiensis]
MREEPLRLLAGVVASALAKSADTDQWPDLRARVVAVLAPTLVDVVSARLDEARRRVVTAPGVRLEQARAEFTTEWRGSIHTMLWQQPEAATSLREVLNAVSPRLPRVTGEGEAVPHAAAYAVHQTGREQAGRNQAGRGQAGRGQAGRGQAGRGQAGWDQAGRDQAGRGGVGWDQAGRGGTGREQVGREQVGRARVRLDQVGRGRGTAAR